MAPALSFFQRACVRQVPVEFRRMNREKLEACTKKVLAHMAREQGIAGWHELTKEALIEALSGQARSRRPRKAPAPAQKRPRLQTQMAAARDTTPTATAEEQVERSKYEVGVPSKDLSAKVPKDLPAG